MIPIQYLNNPLRARWIASVQIVDISRERDSEKIISLPKTSKLLVLNGISKCKLTENNQSCSNLALHK